jgi:predicted DNA-binding protein (MmcQ/YjbR family)
MAKMGFAGAARRIEAAALSWEGIESHPHRFGGRQYRLGGREIGHVHGESLVDIPFPSQVRDEIVNSGQAKPHHVLPKSGWVSVHIRTEADVETAIQLLRQSYEIALRQRPGGREAN